MKRVTLLENTTFDFKLSALYCYNDFPIKLQKIMLHMFCLKIFKKLSEEDSNWTISNKKILEKNAGFLIT